MGVGGWALARLSNTRQYGSCLPTSALEFPPLSRLPSLLSIEAKHGRGAAKVSRGCEDGGRLTSGQCPTGQWSMVSRSSRREGAPEAACARAPAPPTRPASPGRVQHRVRAPRIRRKGRGGAEGLENGGHPRQTPCLGNTGASAASRRCRARRARRGPRFARGAGRALRPPARRAQFAPTLLQPVPARRSWHELRAAGSGNAKKSEIRELPTDRGRKRRKRAVVWPPDSGAFSRTSCPRRLSRRRGARRARGGVAQASAATRNLPRLGRDGVDGPSWTSGVAEGAKEGLGAR